MNKVVLKDISSDHLKMYQKDVENRFIEQCLDHCGGMINYLRRHEKEGKIGSNISRILQTIYILDYTKKFVGPKRSYDFLSSEIFSSLKPKVFYDYWDFEEDLKNKFEKIISKNPNYIVTSVDFEDIKQNWKNLSLDIKEKDEIIKKIEKDMVFQYHQIGSDVDRERRNLVRKIVKFEKTYNGSITEVKLGALIFAFTKKCRNKCRHCMIRKPNFEPFVLTKEKIKEVLDASYDYGIIACDCSGGEPLLEIDSVLFTIENAKMSQIFVTSSSNVAANRDQLEEIIKRIWGAYIKNKDDHRIAIQISLDKFHQEVIRKNDDTLRENSPLIKVVDLIEILFKKYPDIKVNFFSLRSKNEYILKYLLKELERRDIKIVDDEEAFWFWHELTSKIPEKGMDILQAVLRFEVDGREIDAYCGVQSVSELVYTNALCPWEYLGSPYSFDDFKEMKEADRLWMESDMLFTEVDGNVFLGGHLEGAWSLGCLAEESMERIIDSARFDPLIYYINHNFGQIVRWAEELEPNIRYELHPYPTGMSIMHRLFGDPAMRLYLTKRIILEESDKSYPVDLIETLGISSKIDDLKNEYNSKKLSRNRYY